MSQFLAHVLEQAKGKQALGEIRSQAVTKLQEVTWPTRRTEAWRYTSLHALENLVLTGQSPEVVVEAPYIDQLNSIDLVFVNGQLQSDVDAISLPAGVSVHVFSLQEGASLPEAVVNNLNQVKPAEHLFGLVNDALVDEIVYIEVDAGVQVEQPIRLYNLATEGVESHHRVLVNIKDKAKAAIIEHGAGDGKSVNTAYAEYLIGKEATLEHYRFALHGSEAIHIGGVHFRMGEASHLESQLVGFGSEISRIDTDIVHAEQHATANMNCIYLLAPKEHFDLNSLIDHAVANGTTEQNARGIIGDKARAAFSGRILIRPDAQKTLAELHNRNLLMTRGSQINTKPALEIYADDVQCAHGATIAEIDEGDLYYLMSRGITKQQALVMLNFGFIQELVNKSPNEAIADWLTDLLKERFTRMEH